VSLPTAVPLGFAGGALPWQIMLMASCRWFDTAQPFSVKRLMRSVCLPICPTNPLQIWLQ